MSRSLPTVLIVDDEDLFARATMEYLREMELDIARVSTLEAARLSADEKRMDVVLLDQHLPDGLGAHLCPELMEANDLCKIIFVTAFPAFDNVVAALRGGAFDYLVKPVEPEALRLAIHRSLRVIELERSRMVHDREREQAARRAAPVLSTAKEALVRLAELAARANSPVLLSGETGTGKSMLARAIHFASERREGEFVPVNCAAIPEALIEAELFGYEKGTFTGAVGPREGLFEVADGGTILLDEVTELPLHLQARLLHVLEDHTIRRLGGRSVRKVDFRLIAATNLDPAKAVADRRLREDLFHRLNVIPIRLPPLRDRLEDLPVLVERLLLDLGLTAEAARERLAESEIQRLASYRWPGNIRELRNVLERAVLLSDGGSLRPSDLIEFERFGRVAEGSEVELEEEEGGPTLAEVEKGHILKTLEVNEGNVARTARVLRISRSTLRRKLDSFGPM